jgi:hypothetical protein
MFILNNLFFNNLYNIFVFFFFWNETEVFITEYEPQKGIQWTEGQ